MPRHPPLTMIAMSFRTAFFALIFLVAQHADAADPAAAIARAKEQIHAGDHAAALQSLRGATPTAAAMIDLHQRTAALSAIHFYSALAELSLGEKEQATSDLRSFLFYSPAATLDASRFPTEFVSLFEQTRRRLHENRENPASFDDAYPGFPPAVSSSVWPLAQWGASSEFMVLATAEEKEQWSRLADDAARRNFIDAFWLARDSDSSTKVNEARVEFLSRIAFADVAFAEGPDGRGSLSDRGRAFVLLGAPQRVSVRPMNRREAWYQPRRTIDAGNAIEQWTYFRDQLPKKLPNNEVVFRFISEGGSPRRKMEREFLAEKALQDAPAALRHD